ncbi:EpsG family protein [Aeromonas caviae]|uniref:EpsG family protein n=1 Tax=Aeromonas caviae TaxID=648 RepID=UPI0038D19C1B
MSAKVMVRMILSKHVVGLYITYFLFVVLCFVSGNRSGGYDYDNYLKMISYIQNGESVWDKIILAKDPLFGFIVYLINPTSNEFNSVFMAVAIIACLTKYFYLSKIKRPILFFLLYLPLFSPSLDFAAIRAMMGIMFLLAALACKDNRSINGFLFFGVLAFLSHVSMFIPLMFSMSFFSKKFSSHKIIVCLIVLILSFFLKPVISLFSNTVSYIESGGTYLAFFPIILVILSLLCIGIYIDSKAESDFNATCYRISFLVILLSLGTASDVVIVSARLMQLSQVLLLINICNSLAAVTRTNCYFYMLSLIFFLIPLIYRNITMSLWSESLKYIGLIFNA